MVTPYNKNQISIKQMITDLNIDVVTMPDEIDYTLYTSDVNRPGIQLAGFYGYFPSDRIQIIGQVEYAYLMSLDEDAQRKVLEKYLSYSMPAIFMTRGQKPGKSFVEIAKKYNQYLLISELPTKELVNKLVVYIKDIITPKEVVHGGLLDVDGVGILIKGKSGIGKSETALELIRRGYRLISDDVVEIRKSEDGILVGTSPKITKNLMEIRGIGLLDIQNLFGVGAVKQSKAIDMIVYLENWENGRYYDRLGIDSEYEDIFGISINKIIMPVRPGRNIATIIEVAARNFRQKLLGYNVAKVLEEKSAEISSKKNSKEIF